MTKRILIPMAPGCEELEVVTMTNLFRRAGFAATTATLADDTSPVQCARGTLIVPETTLDQVINEDFDLLALPGGQPGTNNLLADERILSLVKDRSNHDRYIAAICAAPMVLGKAGILEGRNATSYPGCLDSMGLNLNFKEDTVVIDGKVITSRGPGTAMDFALAIIEILAGTETRRKVEDGLQRPCKK